MAKVQETKEVILLLLYPDDVRTREPGLWLTDSGQVRPVSLGKLELSHVLIRCAFSKLELANWYIWTSIVEQKDTVSVAFTS